MSAWSDQIERMFGRGKQPALKQYAFRHPALLDSKPILIQARSLDGAVTIAMMELEDADIEIWKESNRKFFVVYERPLVT